MPAFQTHGGRLAAAVAAFPDAPRPWIDLSTGINPWPWPVPAIPGKMWERLPDPAALHELEQAAAEYFGVDRTEALVAVPGSEIGLRQIAQLRHGVRVAIVSPTYSGHRAAWAGHSMCTCTWAQAEANIDDLDVLVLVRPNNPDGGIVGAGRLADVARRLAARGGWLVIDEAFADTGDAGAAAWGDILPTNVIRLRSFGKFFGLAGVRLGFVIADAAIVGRVRAMLGDWPVSGPAIEIGTRAYRDRTWQATMRAALAAAAVRLDRLLEQHGLRVLGGTTLFRLIHDPRAAALFNHLARAGILSRPFADQPDWLRFGLPGADEDWLRLNAALASWEHQHDRR